MIETNTTWACCLALIIGLTLVAPAESAETSRSLDLEKLFEDAHSGQTAAMVALGEHYQDKAEPEFAKALMWYEKAAELGDAAAMERIGGLYREGFGVNRNYAIAMKWLQRAVDAGDVRAIASIGWMHFHGFGVPKDTTEALRWYRAAAEKGNPEGENNLGHMYLNGIGVERNVNRAIALFQSASKAGNAWAYDNLGVLYLEGNGVPCDMAIAKSMFRQAAALGLTDSMIRLGRLEKAASTPETDIKAFEWFQQAAASPEGMRELAECYFDGIGAKCDPQEATAWYERAIAAGHPFAVVDLTDRIRLGRGIQADPERATNMLRVAASGGNAAAATKLGHIASDAADRGEAVRYYTMAAKLGEPTAMLCLAINYKNGWGVEKNEEQATLWMRRAAENGNDIARQIVSQMDR